VKKLKVLLNDGLSNEGIRLFQEAGIEVDTKRRDTNQLISEIGQFDALIVRSSTKVTKKIIESGALGKLKVIGRAGVGYDNIDVSSASKNGIVVKYAPYGNTNAVAELTLGLILSISRNIPQAHQSLKSGTWKKAKLRGTELSYKILGILGCGKIGNRVGELARRGFDMEVLGYDICPCFESNIKMVSKEEVLSKSDYVTIHTGGNRVIVGEKELSLMKPTAYLINTSRGSNIDTKALYKILKEKKIAGAALDVFTEEPKAEGADFRSGLSDLNNVILSSHLGASTIEAQRETSMEIARVIIGYLLGGDFANSVNAGESIELEEQPVYPLFIHHRDVPGVFANIDKLLADNEINIRANYSRQIGKTGYAISVYVLHKKVPTKIVNKLKKIENICTAKA
jgi:D-3-phosphoglycerate dehydrogenase